MSIVDAALLVCAALTALSLCVPRLARTRSVLAALLAALCLTQLWVEGLYWQCLPAWVLVVLALVSRRRDAPPRWPLRLAIPVMALLTALLLACCWIILPVPRFPLPSGPHAVGTMVFRWQQHDREEPATEAASDRRDIIVQAWYPAAPTASSGAARGPYMDGLDRLPDRVSGVPRAFLRRFGEIETHARWSTPVLGAEARWPVIVFSPGYGAARAFYSVLLADLASRGFIVLALDHPYESAVTQLTDGRVVGPIETFLPNDPGRVRYMIQHTATRVADIEAVIDAARRNDASGPLGTLTAQMDRARIATVGHSFGGAASVSAAAADPEVRAAVNIDGAMYGPLPVLAPTQRFLLIESDRRETKHGARFLDGQAQLLASLHGAGQRHQVVRANHYSFTDAPLLLSPPWRWLASLVVGGSKGTTATVHETNDHIADFLRGKH